MEVPQSQRSRKPGYPWFSFLLPLVLFVGLAVAAFRLFGLLNPAALPFIVAGLIALLGVTIAAGVYSSYRLSVSVCTLKDEIDSREALHRELAARLVVLEEERSDYERSVYETGLEVERRTYAYQREKEELAESAKAADDALRESEDRWIRLIENHPEGVLVSAGRKILYVNEAAVQVLGARNAEDVIGTDILRYSPRTIHEQLSERIAAVESGQSNDSIEYPIIGLDGEERLVEAFGLQIVFRGQPGVQIVIRDITTKREAERGLRKLADRLAVVNEIEKNILLDKKPGEVADHALTHLIRLVPCHRAVVLTIANESGETDVLASHAVANISHFQGGAGDSLLPPDPVSGTWRSEPRHVRSLGTQYNITPLDQALLDEGVDSVIEVPLVVRQEVVGMLLVGSESRDGFDDAQVEIVKEIGDLIALGLHQYQIEQERLSYEIELLAAKDHAEEMVRLKTAFLTNMSHEIRTPLTGIIGFAQILSEEIVGEHSEFVNLIEQSGRRLLDTINSVLDLARLESNRMQMTLEPINIVQEAKRSVKLLNPLATKKDLWLKLDCELEEVWLELDSAGLDRILNNLIGNAIKFTTTGGIVVRIRQTEAAAELSVQDTGIGMSDKFLPMLFEEFRQESSGADRSHEGSGMGLSITRKLVEIMGGTIAVESKKGAGTTLTVSFPTRKPVVTTAPDRPPVRSDPSPLERPVVLVVEDQEEARFLLQYVLHSTFDIRLAPDMAVATEIARSTEVAALLLEIHLGGTQGAMADVTRFRKTDTLANIPIIGMTAYPWHGEREDLLAAGYDDYVSRPFEREIVCGILEKYLGPAAGVENEAARTAK